MVSPANEVHTPVGDFQLWAIRWPPGPVSKDTYWGVALHYRSQDNSWDRSIFDLPYSARTANTELAVAGNSVAGLYSEELDRSFLLDLPRGEVIESAAGRVLFDRVGGERFRLSGAFVQLNLPAVGGAGMSDTFAPRR